MKWWRETWITWEGETQEVAIGSNSKVKSKVVSGSNSKVKREDKS